MLAACATFQSWVGAEDATEAKSSIWYESLPLPAGNAEVYSAADVAAYWPYGLIYVSEYRVTPVAVESETDGGMFVLQLVGMAEDSSNDPSEALVKFENYYAKIIEELSALRDTAGYLSIGELSIAAGPMRENPEDIAAGGRDEYAVYINVPWSAGGV